MDLVKRVSTTRLQKTDDASQFPQLSTPSRVEAFKRSTILIFEESREMQEHYKQFLKPDYNLLMVETPRYGVRMLQALPVDLILFNVEQNYEIDAVGMLNVFRKIAAGASIPVVAMTGYSGSTERALLRKAQFDAYLERPFTLRQLREIIRRCMAKRTVSILNKVDLSLFSITAGL